MPILFFYVPDVQLSIAKKNFNSKSLFSHNLHSSQTQRRFSIFDLKHPFYSYQTEGIPKIQKKSIEWSSDLCQHLPSTPAFKYSPLVFCSLFKVETFNENMRGLFPRGRAGVPSILIRYSSVRSIFISQVVVDFKTLTIASPKKSISSSELKYSKNYFIISFLLFLQNQDLSLRS